MTQNENEETDLEKSLKEIPPLVFIEEAEKADLEKSLKIWLGALDDGEIRKINFTDDSSR